MKLNNRLIPFDYEGNTVRALSVGGEPWFVLGDLLRSLGISRRPAAVIERLDDDVRQTYPIPDAVGRVQKTHIVSEAGLYDVIMRSDSPAARPFRRWVTHEVLPSFRGSGDLTAATDFTSPFDGIKRDGPNGEYWSARELMPLLGYGADWRNFVSAIDRAKASARAQKFNPEDLFVGVTEKGGGRPREDYLLPRFACYLIAMNGDPRKREVAAAQAYFAVQTRAAETGANLNFDLTSLDSISQILDAGKAAVARAIAAEEQVKSLESEQAENAPKVLFADSVASSASSILVGDLAKILRGNGVEIGGTRLFAWMRERGFLVRRRGSDYNTPTQYAMERGLFEIKETAITHADGHVTVSKTPKVTGKGQKYFINKFLGREAA